MRALVLSLFVFAACGKSGNFTLSTKSYNADQLTATVLATPPAGKIGIDVELKSDPAASAIDDEVLVRVTLLWDEASPPPLNRDLSISEGLIVAVARVGCFCGGKDAAFSEPVVSGKVRFSSLDRTKDGVRGEFDLSFKGQIALTSGGLLYDDDTLKVRASGFEAK